MKQSLSIIIAILALIPSLSQAAVAPANGEKLMEKSQHVITGKVLSVESKVQKSTVEKAMGSKDEIFFIKVKVEFVAKGRGIKPGEEVVVVAWQPHKRIGIAALGLQGHDTIPEKGERVTCYLTNSPGKGGVEGSHDVYMPNGISTEELIEPKG